MKYEQLYIVYDITVYYALSHFTREPGYVKTDNLSRNSSNMDVNESNGTEILDERGTVLEDVVTI